MITKTARPFLLSVLGLLLIMGTLLLGSCGKSSTEPANNPPDQIASFGSSPLWSPDGQKLVFGGEDISTGLWVYDRSSGQIQQITDDSYPHLWDYSWSPASDRIAFGGAGATIENTTGIFTVALDGSDPIRWHETGSYPSWKPDGSGLVFVEDDVQTGATGLYTLTFSGPTVAPLISEGVNPKYNPSGTKIAYKREPGASLAYSLKVVLASGSGMTTVADTCLHFCWTADGATLVYDYMSYNAGMRICKVPAAGGAQVVIASGASEPSIASTGLIAYQGVNSDLSLGIWAINLDGSGNHQLTDTGFQPSITPDGALIAYARDNGIWLVTP